ncbi:hypothetical protein CY34DRAFT_811757 [Suillus luteus UH-Slu-Lm8-n1]|uniref:Uncharacterized protein n=1 Tax=Suillus luteus UH-Slu-Lm8-n1 TaxID=930992 RepID=A0A0C9ZEP6_9AGAM|nr:hypothetical protein CY34DRAFT_811757 [Suillus luteus UH-Slu-Lm8-n1]
MSMSPKKLKGLMPRLLSCSDGHSRPIFEPGTITHHHHASHVDKTTKCPGQLRKNALGVYLKSS